jgi:hypothetical protein
LKYPKIIIIASLAALLLAACSPIQKIEKDSEDHSASTGCTTPEAGKIGVCKQVGDTSPTSTPKQSVVSQADLTESDDQGAVTVEVKPLNLNETGDFLVFDVSMNTHSVDLSMDLTQLAILSTDTGKTVQAIQWDAPSGGHHVEGKLTFPKYLDGKNIFEGASNITIIIKDVDAPVRTFTWNYTG